MPDDLVQRLRDEGLDPITWTNGPGDRYGAHDHDYDKVIVVERGRIRFRLPATDAAFNLSEGDRLELPASTSHEALVGPGGVTCLEAHLPAGALARVHVRPAGRWDHETDAHDPA